MEQLRQLERAHNLRLNLTRRDEAMAALLRGIRLLRRVDPLLERIELLSVRERARLLHTLKEATRLLNADGYEGSLDVSTDEPGWEKAVLVTLPRA